MLAVTERLGRPARRPNWPLKIGPAPGWQGRGLRACLPMQGRGGAAWDVSGRNAHGTRTGTLAQCGWAPAPAWMGGAVLTTDGSAGYCSAPAAWMAGASAASFSTWCYRASTSDTPACGPGLAGDEGGFIWYSDGNVYATAAGQYAVIANSQTGWHHFVWVFDGAGAGNATRLLLYVDGVQQTVGSYSGTVGTALSSSVATWSVGRDQTARFGLGRWADCRLYGRALSAAEAWGLYAPQTRWALYQAGARRVRPSSAGGGVARTASDAPATADSASRAGLFLRTAGDSPTAGDAVARLVALARSVSDAPTYTTSAARAVAAPRTAPDAPTLSDTAARAFSGTRSLPDAPTCTTTAARALSSPRAAADAPTCTTSLTRALALARTSADAPTHTDSPARLVVLARAPSDAPTYSTAAAAVAGTVTRTLADAPTLSDTATRQLALGRAAADAPASADAPGRSVVLARAAADLTTCSAPADASAVSAVTRSASDAATLADAAARQLALARPLPNDLGRQINSYSDAVSRTLALTRQFAAAATFTTLVSATGGGGVVVAPHVTFARAGAATFRDEAGGGGTFDTGGRGTFRG